MVALTPAGESHLVFSSRGSDHMPAFLENASLYRPQIGYFKVVRKPL